MGDVISSRYTRLDARADELRRRADRTAMRCRWDTADSRRLWRNSYRLNRKAKAVDAKIFADHRSGRRVIIPF